MLSTSSIVSPFSFSFFSGILLNHFLTLSLSSSLSMSVSILPGFLSSVISTPLYLSAVTYKGSRIPVFFNRSVDNSSSGVLSAIILPSSINMTLSTLLYKTSSILCSIITIVAPVFLWSSSISSIVIFPLFGSRLASGSSKRKILTLSTRTPASDTLCFCPPDSDCGECLRNASIPTFFAALSTSSFISERGVESFSSAKAMSSPTVRPMNCPS